MGHVAVWKVLEQALTGLKKKRVAVPAKIMSDLRNAKTTIQILKADPSIAETMQKVEEYLANLESYIVSEAQKVFGPEYVGELLRQVDEASRSCDEEEREARFVAGVSRQQKWIRITPSSEMPVEKLKKLAEVMNLSFSIQKEGFLLVQGEEESIRDFVKKMATEYEAKSAKYRQEVHNC